MNLGRLLLPALGVGRALRQKSALMGCCGRASRGRRRGCRPGRTGPRGTSAPRPGEVPGHRPAAGSAVRTKGQMAIDILGDARCRRPHLRLRLRLARGRLPAARRAGPPQSCAAPCWSWPPRRSAPSPPPSSGTAPTPEHPASQAGRPAARRLRRHREWMTGSVDSSNVPAKCGLRPDPDLRQICTIVDLLSPARSAIEALDQCVAICSRSRIDPEDPRRPACSSPRPRRPARSALAPPATAACPATSGKLSTIPISQH
jgi:hypothetical protein